MPIDLLASADFRMLRHFVSTWNVHPILVNFTAALIPVSVSSDILARVFEKPSLRDTGWWTLCFAAIITPFTASAGWLLWMHDDNGVIGMTIHKWLGTSLSVLLIGLVLWRWVFFKRSSNPGITYLLLASLIVGAVFYQGHLGGKQSFGCFSVTLQNTLLTNSDVKWPSGAVDRYSRERAAPFLAIQDEAHPLATGRSLPCFEAGFPTAVAGRVSPRQRSSFTLSRSALSHNCAYR